MTISPLQDLVADAADALAGARWPVMQAQGHVPTQPGLYAIYGDDAAWSDLGLDPVPSDPLYVGKAEGSLVERDLSGHFATNPNSKPRTGSSIVRRSFAALLRDRLKLQAAPRNLARPGHFTSYGLAEGGEERLSEWMHSRLSLAVWLAPADMRVPLKDIETAIIERLRPPINIDKNPGRLARLSRARAEMAAAASRWPVRDVLRLEITTTPRETLVWAPTAQDASDLRRFLTTRDHLVLEADPWELVAFQRIPDAERNDFDPARILDVEIGAEAFGSLTALVGAGHELRWHRWEGDRDGSVWGVEVAVCEDDS